jgi:transposase
MSKRRRRYTAEFKQEAVRLFRENGESSVADIARDLGVDRSQIYKWEKELAAAGGTAFPGGGDRGNGEVARLKRELARVTEELEIVKKAAAYFAKNQK